LYVSAALRCLVAKGPPNRSQQAKQAGGTNFRARVRSFVGALFKPAAAGPAGAIEPLGSSLVAVVRL